MIIEIGPVRIWGILVATVASSVLGGLWFAGLFPRHYALALGRPHTLNEKPAAIYIVGPFFCGLATVVTSAVLIQALGIESMMGALTFGAIVGLGYLASTTVNTAINPNIPRPLLYGLISGMYFFISSIVVSSILVAMR